MSLFEFETCGGSVWQSALSAVGSTWSNHDCDHGETVLCSQITSGYFHFHVLTLIFHWVRQYSNIGVSKKIKLYTLHLKPT